MMRCRVFTWLAALVVLAGCVESNVEESVSRAADGLVVEQSCINYSLDGPHTKYNHRMFRLHPDSDGSYNIRVSDAENKILFRYHDFVRRKECAYFVEFDTFANTQQPNLEFSISEIPFEQRALLPIEETAFENQIELCQRQVAAGNQGFTDVSIRYDENFGALDTYQFIGCEALVKNETKGLFATLGNRKYRIFLTMDQLVTTLEND